MKLSQEYQRIHPIVQRRRRRDQVKRKRGTKGSGIAMTSLRFLWEIFEIGFFYIILKDYPFCKSAIIWNFLQNENISEILMGDTSGPNATPSDSGWNDPR